MKDQIAEKIRALEDQIQKLRGIRKRWEDDRQLTDDEKIKKSITLELIDQTLGDLQRKKRELRDKADTSGTA